MSTAGGKSILVGGEKCIRWRDEKGPARGPSHWRSAGLRLAGVLAGRAPPLLALPEPIALTVHLEDVDVMGEAVEGGTRQALGTEQPGPLIQRQIARDDDRAPL